MVTRLAMALVVPFGLRMHPCIDSIPLIPRGCGLPRTSNWLVNHAVTLVSLFSLQVSRSGSQKSHARRLLPWILPQKCTTQRLLPVAAASSPLQSKHRRRRPFPPHAHGEQRSIHDGSSTEAAAPPSIGSSGGSSSPVRPRLAWMWSSVGAARPARTAPRRRRSPPLGRRPSMATSGPRRQRPWLVSFWLQGLLCAT